MFHLNDYDSFRSEIMSFKFFVFNVLYLFFTPIFGTTKIGNHERHPSLKKCW